MPTPIIHRCVSKRVLEKSNLYNNLDDIHMYEVGSIAPDSWRNSSRFKNSTLKKIDMRKYSHFSKDGEYLEQYMDFYNKYRNKLDLPFMIGYLVHLLTDVIWREVMFYRCFDENGHVKLLDGSILIKEKEEIKEILKEETSKISRLLVDKFNLKEMIPLSDDELNNLPIMDEIEFDGVNESVNYANYEANRNLDNNLIIYNVDEFVLGVEEVSNFILNKLKELEIIKE